VIFFTTFCECFPATDLNLATKTNATDPNLIAIILQKPGPNNGFGVGAVQSRKLKEIFSWLQPIFSAAAQAAGDAVNNAGLAGESILNSVLGNGNSFAYPFAYRR
jgi:hypothetical protein